MLFVRIGLVEQEPEQILAGILRGMREQPVKLHLKRIMQGRRHAAQLKHFHEGPLRIHDRALPHSRPISLHDQATLPDEAGVLAKISEDLAELHHAIAAGDAPAIAEETGDLLFSIVNLTRFRRLDPELLMATANAKFEQRFGAMERLLEAAGLSLEAATLEQMEAAWQQAKVQLKESS